MKRLFFTELLKLLPFRTSWVIVALFILLIPLAYGILPTIIPAQLGVDAYSIYDFAQIWNFLPYVSAYFTTLLGVLLIVSISNDFTFGTLRQNLIDGFSRKDWLTSKYLLSLLLAVIATITVLVTGVAYSAIYGDEGTFLGNNGVHLLIYLLQTIGILSFSILVGVAFQRSGISIVLFFLYTVLLEPAVGYLLPKGWSLYLPMNTINNLLPFPINLGRFNAEGSASAVRLLGDPLIDSAFFLALAYMVVFAGISYWILTKRDL
jgi:ABC-2 type transport system permease protein